MNKLFLLGAILFGAFTIESCLFKRDTTATDDTSDDAGSGSDTTTTTTKAIATVWITPNKAWSINMLSAVTNGNSFVMTVDPASGTQQCSCTIALNGTDSSGTCTVTSCTYTGTTTESHPGDCVANGWGICAGNGYTHTSTTFKFTNTGFSYE